MSRTRRSRRVALPAAALMLSAPLLLTGCSMLGSSTDKSSSSSSAAASDAAAPSGSSGASDSSGSSSDDGASESSSSSSSDGQSADASGKPSKEDVKNGLRTYYAGQGLPSVAAETFASCMVDEGYDSLSAKTLNAMKDGKPENVDPADSTTFTKLSTTCGARLSGGALPSNLPVPS